MMWLEDLLTGDYVPWVHADQYREVTRATTTPIHTGEQIYLRQNFKDLIEKQAVRIVGPDPCDVGGIAELKWIAEYADLHGILMAPHGIGDGLFGLAALVQVCATLPAQLHRVRVSDRQAGRGGTRSSKGCPTRSWSMGTSHVGNRPGMGVDLIPERAIPRTYATRIAEFFDTLIEPAPAVGMSPLHKMALVHRPQLTEK